MNTRWNTWGANTKEVYTCTRPYYPEPAHTHMPKPSHTHA